MAEQEQGVAELTELTRGEEAFKELRFPLPMDYRSSRDFANRDWSSLESSVVKKLKEIGTENYSDFCGESWEYITRLSQWHSMALQVEKPEERALMPEEIKKLEEIPNPSYFNSKYVNNYLNISDRIIVPTLIGMTVIGGALGAIGGGELADHYMENNQIANHLTTGLATIVGVAGGFGIGAVIAERVDKYYKKKSDEEKEFAKGVFIKEVEKYLWRKSKK